jgi:agmatine deiminase
MAWPCRREAWDGPAGLARAKNAYANVAKAISRFEPVVMAARPQDVDEARQACRCDIFEVGLDDSWARDIGPTFVTGPAGRAGVQWRFNAWGGKYRPFDQDAAFAARVAEKAGVPLRRAPIICEGGAIHSDGQGTLLTTEQCLLNPNRNPGLSKKEVEQALRDLVGARRVIWLGEGFSDSETDGHVDNIACFAGAGGAILGVPDSKSHPDHAPAVEARRRLREAGLEVIELVQPRAIRHDRSGRLLQTSYVNFYLCNGGLVMPSFDDAHDEQAKVVLADCFPDLEIVTVPALDIVAGGGGIHCITQQEPA